MIAMKVGRMMLLFFVISWMIIHFGINQIGEGVLLWIGEWQELGRL